MAGRPKRRLLLIRIKAFGGFEAILNRVASGETMKSIAKDYDCSPFMIWELLRKNPKLQSLFQTAKAAAALHHAEEALRVIEEVNPDSAFGAHRMAQAKALAEHHRWLASKFDKEYFGEEKAQKTQVNLQLNVGDLHLDTLRQLPRQTVRQLECGNNLDVETIPNEREVE